MFDQQQLDVDLKSYYYNHQVFKNKVPSYR